MKRVLILYKFLPQYRVDFFNQLKDELYKKDIELILVYGKMKDAHSIKKDEVDLSWAIYRENKVISIGKTDLLWQPALNLAIKSDLVIVEHANKLLVNYVLIFMRIFSNMKLAFWGHGRNMQGKVNGFKNRLKYAYIGWCDHWFAYTEGVKEFLIEKNVSEDIITVVNNAIDTKLLRSQYLECSIDEIDKVKKELQIKGDNIAVYSGALYDIKKIDFLIKSAIEIRKDIDNFHLIIIGSGSDGHIVEKASKQYAWIHCMGPKFAKDKVVYFRIASIFMLPGAVGLAVLDSFATETPMITTDIPLHGPEIDYLRNNINGVMTKFDIVDYTSTITNLLKNRNVLDTLKQGCLSSLEYYTVEHMVEEFSKGVEKCLES